MQTINATYTEEKQPGAQEVSLHIDGLPSGGSGAASVDTLDGATDTGKAVMKAADAAAAREAIGAGTSEFSGSYNDLSNKPTIPSAYTLPAATTSALGGVKQAAHVDGSTGTVQQVVDVLVAAGIMAAS